MLGGYASNTAGGALQRIGTAKIVVVQPYDANNQIMNLIRGDDYATNENRTFDFQNTLGQWPSMAVGTTATCTFNGTSYPVTVAMSVGTHPFYVRIVLPSTTHKVTILQGTVNVSEPDEITS